MKPHPAEGGGATDLSRPMAERHDTDAARERRIARANAVAWVIRTRGCRLTSAQLTAIEEILRWA